MRITLIGLLLFGLVEIGLLIWVGTKIGVLSVLLLIILTGLLGIIFARIQGFETWNRAIRSMEQHQAPAAEIIDGLCIILGAILLIIPGFISDIIGLCLLFPWTRNLLKRRIAKLFQKMTRNGIVIYRKF
jgi:UPF0716 protein FxsA